MITLLYLCTGRRSSELEKLDLMFMSCNPDSFMFNIQTPVKTYRKGIPKTIQQIIVKRFCHDIHVCPYLTLAYYLERTAEFRNVTTKKLIFSPFTKKNVTKDTLAHWLKTVLRLSGINVEKYSTHSTRAATASKAFQRGCNISDIMAHVGWRSEHNFAKYYLKQIDNMFTDAVLQ